MANKKISSCGYSIIQNPAFFIILLVWPAETVVLSLVGKIRSRGQKLEKKKKATNKRHLKPTFYQHLEPVYRLLRRSMLINDLKHCIGLVFFTNDTFRSDIAVPKRISDFFVPPKLKIIKFFLKYFILYI